MKMDLYSQNNFLANFHPNLRKNFEELFYNGKIGLTTFTINDVLLNKQCQEDDLSYTYHYTLKIPYAGKRLHWELIFNPEDITFAPDFNFNDDNFQLSHDLEKVIDSVPSLVNWNVTNSKALVSVLEEFLNLFKRQQILKLQKENVYSHLNNEYTILLAENLVSEEDIEVFLETNVAHFLINIKVDLSSLPEFMQSKNEREFNILNPGSDVSILKVSYMKFDGSTVNTSLQLSPRIDQLLGSVKIPHIPPYTKKTALPEYVSSIMKLLNEHIQRVKLNNKLKRDLINILSTLFATNMIEFDTEAFSRAVFLCEVDNYHCLVHINISDTFPKDKPAVMLQSLYCFSSKGVCVDELDNYPYSPRWTPEVMIKKIIEHLKEAIPVFKNHKH